MYLRSMMLRSLASKAKLSGRSNANFESKYTIVDVFGMGSGVKSKVMIMPGEIVALYSGKMATCTLSNFSFSTSEYSVSVHMEITPSHTPYHLVLVGDPEATGPAALLNDCRISAKTTSVATTNDLERMNARLVQTNVFGYPLVFVVATKCIIPNTMMLMDYGKTFWKSKK
jgi:hypothetical protein